MESLEQLRHLTTSIKEIVAFKVFGITTARLQRYLDSFETINEIAMRRLGAFRDHIENVGEDGLTNSYFYKILSRQPDSDVTEKECMELCVLLLTAAVDTTAAKMSWSILHLSLRQDIQEELRRQLERAVAKHGGLVPSIFDNLNEEVPLLPAVIRVSGGC